MLRTIALSLLVLLGLATARSGAAPGIVVDVQSGRVIAAEQAFDRWSPASLTKLMTAYVIFREIEAGNLTLRSPVRMSNHAANHPPSKMGYKVGAVMTVENALEMIIVKSANDVAVALGEAVSGSEPSFIAAMNREATLLGMTDTNFVNPHGLHHPDQYTTARDLALLATAIRKNFPQYDPIFAAEAIRIGDEVTATYNLLLGRYAGADGMKTGFVCASGFNLVASATRQGQTMVAIVLGATSQKTRAERSVALLEQGFASTQSQATSLLALPRPADVSNTIADLRLEVCTEEARAQRWDGRQIEGYIEFDTPLISAMQRTPNALDSGLGGADGVSKSAVVLNGRYLAAYPVPADRPDQSDLVGQNQIDDLGLRQGIELPVPAPRPENG